MSTEPTYRTCGARGLVWDHGEPAGPLRAVPLGWCWWHDVERQMSNGGLPVAEIRTGVLDQILAAFDKDDERQALRIRGIRYTVRLGGRSLELTA